MFFCGISSNFKIQECLPTTDTSLFLITYRCGSHLPTDILFSLIELGCKEHTNALENLYEYDKQYNSYDHNTCLIAVISITNSDISKSAATNSSCHSGITKNCSDGDCYSDKKRSSCFCKKNFPDDRRCSCAHADCCLEYSRFHFFQRRFHHTGNERSRAAITSGTIVALEP